MFPNPQEQDGGFISRSTYSEDEALVLMRAANILQVPFQELLHLGRGMSSNANGRHHGRRIPFRSGSQRPIASSQPEVQLSGNMACLPSPSSTIPSLYTQSGAPSPGASLYQPQVHQAGGQPLTSQRFHNLAVPHHFPGQPSSFVNMSQTQPSNNTGQPRRSGVNIYPTWDQPYQELSIQTGGIPNSSSVQGLSSHPIHVPSLQEQQQVLPGDDIGLQSMPTTPSDSASGILTPNSDSGSNSPFIPQPENARQQDLSHFASLDTMPNGVNYVTLENDRSLGRQRYFTAQFHASNSPAVVSFDRNYHHETQHHISNAEEAIIACLHHNSRPHGGSTSKVAKNGGVVKKRGRFKDPVKKKETAETRKLIACIRCNHQRIRCDVDQNNPHGPCLKCLVTRTKVNLQCFRLKISITFLYRDGPTALFKWTVRPVEPEPRGATCPKPAIRHLHLTQGLSQRQLPLDVERYEPQPGDKQHYDFETGYGKGRFECPPFAVANVYQATKDFKEYIDLTWRDYIFNSLYRKDPISNLIFEMALHRLDSASCEEEEKSLIRDSLTLWVAARFIEQPWRIDGRERLEMRTDPFSPYSSHIPVPPAIDNQIDQIVIRNILKPLGASILKGLDDLHNDNAKNRQKNWLRIFLCSAILLNNYEVATAHDVWFAEFHGLKERYSNPKLLENFEEGAKTVLAHFHYTCNGEKPFTLDWNETSDGPVAAAELGDVERRYMTTLTSSISNNAPRFQELKESGRFEEDLYFTSQLFDPKWGQRDSDA